MVSVTCVMYHHVRNPEDTRFPRVKTRRVDEFVDQLDYMERNYNFISVLEFVESVKRPEVAKKLPENPIMLTFDDAYIEHHRTVFPILYDKAIEGVFFAPAGPSWYGKMLAPNAIHAILSCCDDHSVIVDKIDSIVLELQGDRDIFPLGYYYNKWHKPDKYNTADTRYVKRMLQTGLPEEPRVLLVQSLFSKWVTEDEASLVAEYYASADDLREMVSAGMYVAPHSVHHHWMNLLPRDRMEHETRQSLEFMQQLGAPTNDWIACYPFGGFSDELVDVCVQHGAVCGFTTESGLSLLGVHDKMLFPRVDTDDVPFGEGERAHQSEASSTIPAAS